MQPTTQQLHADLRRRDAILGALGRSAEALLRAPRWEDAAPEMLARLGAAAEVSRAYLFRVRPGGGVVDRVLGWAGPGIDPDRDNPALRGWDLAAAGLGRWVDRLSAGEAVWGTVSSLPAAERAAVEAHRVCSLAVVPVFADGAWWGFIGLDDCAAERDWSGAELEALRVAAGTLGAALDRFVLEQDRREVEERYRTLADATLEGIVIQRDGVILDANDSLLRMLGYTRAELEGMNAYELAAPESRETLRRRVAEDATAPYEVVGLRRDGSRFPAELVGRTVSYRGARVRVVVVRDLTEARRAAEAAERLARETAARAAAEAAERRAGFMAEASRVLGASFDYHTTLATLARLAVPALADYCVVDVLEPDTGFTRVGVAHRDAEREPALREVLHFAPGTLPDEHPVMRALSRGEPTLVPEVTEDMVRAVVAHEHHLELVQRLGPRSLVTVPIAGAGRAQGALTLCMTDSGRRYGPDDLVVAQELARRTGLAIDNARLFHAAQQATRARDEMLAVVAHDLRNPLGTVSMGSALLLDRLGSVDDVERKYLEIIQRSADRMNRLIGDLLDVSRIQGGRLAVEPRPEEARGLVHDAFEMLKPLAESRGMRFETSVAPDLPPVHADASRVLQVISNLVGNALKFTPAGGEVRLEADAAEGGVRFTVSDTGPGIPEEQLPHIFNRFWQAQAADQRGIGLGLAIAQGIVEAHGGRIWVTSRVGEGTHFHFTLPAAAPLVI